MYFTITDIISIVSIVINCGLVWHLSTAITKRHNAANNSTSYIIDEITKFYDSFNTFCLESLQSTNNNPQIIKHKLDGYIERSNMIDSFIVNSFGNSSRDKVHDYVFYIYQQVDNDVNFSANFRHNQSFGFTQITITNINISVNVIGCKHIKLIDKIIKP